MRSPGPRKVGQFGVGLLGELIRLVVLRGVPQVGERWAMFQRIAQLSVHFFFDSLCVSFSVVFVFSLTGEQCLVFVWYIFPLLVTTSCSIIA